MPATTLRKPVTLENFGQAFASLRTTTYYDPASRGPGSHTIRSIAWNPTGHLIATGAQDRILRIWNPEKPQVKNSTELKGHTGAIERVAWNPTKEAELASISLDGTVRFWDVRSKNCIETVSLGARGLSLVWADDGRLVIAGKGDRAEDEALVPISLPGYTTLPSLPQGGQVNQVVIAPTLPDSSVYYLLITCGNGTVRIATYPKPNSTPSSPNHETTTTTTSNNNTSTLQTIYTFQAHTSAAQCLSLSPDGRWLATGGSDAMTMLWDTRDWICTKPLSHAQGTVRAVSFSFDGRYLCAASEDSGATDTLDIIHVESGQTVASVPLQGNQAGMPRAVSTSIHTTTDSSTGTSIDANGNPKPQDVIVEQGIGAKAIGKGLVKVSNVGSVASANCVAWHPQRYWLAYSGEPGGLRVIGAAGGVL